MSITSLYRVLADDTRRKLVKLLLKYSYCVSELARVLRVSESAVSQHLRVLKEANMLIGEKRGYYMHYDIDREKLRALAREIDGLANLERQTDTAVEENICDCQKSGNSCSAEVKFFCHGTTCMEGKVQLPMAPLQSKKD